MVNKSKKESKEITVKKNDCMVEIETARPVLVDKENLLNEALNSIEALKFESKFVGVDTAIPTERYYDTIHEIINTRLLNRIRCLLLTQQPVNVQYCLLPEEYEHRSCV